MSLSGGVRLGPYEIVAPIGAGGMGEVYRATDTKLKRQVAVKILPPAMAADPDRLARFQREAEVLASLNHPHIAAVYGFEDTADAKALVMELVEGPTLADRIAHGLLPINEALPIARQIAEALEAAHDRGIVHRDLKPANIKVRDDGTVKVLDFGLAKLTQPDGTGQATRRAGADSPTLTSPAAMTEIGMILGTAAYMSPEQARGKAVDKRSDVWAFGAVLYEMLTGTRAFGASSGDEDTVTDLIASVLTSTPNWSLFPPDVPPAVVTLVQRCLEKDRHGRVGDIAVARFILADHATLGPSLAAASGTNKRHVHQRQMLPWVVTALLATLLMGALVALLRSGRQAETLPLTRLQMSVAPADYLQGSITTGVPARPPRTAMAMSPEGRLVVFGGARGSTGQLYSRSLDRSEATPVPGTDNAYAPFLSPDGQWIGFFADGKIRKVPVAGGPPAAICDVSGQVSSASWGENGSIVFATFGDGIFSVSADGGTPVKVSAPDASKGERLLLPHWLPGAKAFLLTAIASTEWDTANVALQPLDGGERRTLIPGGADARYVDTGHLVFMKSGTLNAVPFDLDSQQVTGAAVPLIENVMQGVNASNSNDETGAGQFAISASGTLLYVPGGINPSRQNTLVWVNRKGGVEPLTAIPTGSYLGPRLSPDGTKMVVQVRRPTSRGADLWVYDLLRGALTRLTFDGNAGTPVWSPDGAQMVYGSGGLTAIYADGGREPERVTASDVNQVPSTWAPTNVLAFLQRTPDGSDGIWFLPMDGNRTPELSIESPFRLWHPELSPDGRWLAYVSDESGPPAVYVQPYPGPGQKTRISPGYGSEPLWTPNGREILYRSGTSEHQQVFGVTISSLSPFRTDPPRLLFEARPDEYDSTIPTRSWDVSPDGQRFLMLRVVPSTDRPATSMHVVLNWTEELKRLVPAK